MRPLFLLFLARIREFYREPAALFWTFGFPALLAVALGIAFNEEGDQRAVSIAVSDGPRQAERAGQLRDDPGLDVATLSEAEAAERFRGGRIVLEVGGDDPIRYRFDPAHPESAAARQRVDDRLQRAAGRVDVLRASDAPVESAGSRYIDFLIPGLIGMNIMSSSMWGIGWTLVEARKRKLLKRLAASPMKRSDFLLSFFAARLVFLAAEMGIIATFGAFAFDVPMLGSVAAFALLGVAGAFAFAGIGFLVASRSENTEVVSGLMNLVMLPMFVFSGVFFTTSRFPDWAQPFVSALPLTTLNEGLRSVANQGAGLGDSLVAVAILALWGTIGMWLALRVFRWT